ncbi:MAG: HEAT repeat domain-containing protein [Sumerlaeia bacterium]
MSTHREEPRRWQFEEMLVLFENGEHGEAQALFEKFVERGPEIFDPLADYIIRQPNHPRIAPLIELLGKIGDNRGVPILTRFLEIEVKELRCAAAISLGWMHARAGLEKLDHLEGTDPDEEVRHEARLAIEEILREFPALRGQLKHHESVALPHEPMRVDDEQAIREMTPPGGEERDRLCCLLPRMLAMKLCAAPLGIGPGGVVAVAIKKDAQEDPSDRLTELMGRQVELHGWPREKVFDRILSFYQYGDDDWVKFAHCLTPAARKEITRLLLGKIAPDEPQTPLDECADASEAVLSFLSICAQEHIDRVLIETNSSRGKTMKLSLIDHDGNAHELPPPSPGVQATFIRALKIVANAPLDAKEAKGLIHTDGPALKEGFTGYLSYRQEPGGAEFLALDFIEPKAN